VTFLFGSGGCGGLGFASSLDENLEQIDQLVNQRFAAQGKLAPGLGKPDLCRRPDKGISPETSSVAILGLMT
jgi:hypothetical protein